ncbi:MAG: DUF5103 domain-containing protein [Bacteroidales bacterium]|nr:DUF5103 domain-containing protein [Bacteroidales bacterium]
MDHSNKNNIVISLTILLISLSAETCPGFNQSPEFYPETYTDSVFSEGIHTVMLRNASWEFTLPVIELNSGQQLELLFDDLSDRSLYLAYTLVHCDSSWRPSSMSQQQYLQGFSEGEIREIYRSFSTTYDYTHYRLNFPEENIKPLISGNYAIVVYEISNPENIILTRRFYIVEKVVDVEADVKRSPPGEYYENRQLLQFSVIDPSHEIRDPDSGLLAVVMQNGRQDNTIRLQKPLYMEPGRFDYTYSDRIMFPGGNEFRNFDTKSLKYQSENIERIDFMNPYWHFLLKPDEPRAHMPFFSGSDLDGAFYIDREKATDKHREADYVYVHFSLDLPEIHAGETVYVFGMFSEWSAGEHNRMTYNPETGYHELTLLLKQGWYDYEYVLKKTNSGIDEVSIEGSHHETGNTYTIFVYYHDLRQNFDRLIGYRSIKSS